MKRLIYLLLLTCLAFTAVGQQKPVYENSRLDQVSSDRAKQARFVLIIPGGSTPGFPAYVPDSVKNRAIYKANGLNPLYPQGIYFWDPTILSWVRIAQATNGQFTGNTIFKGTGSYQTTTGINGANISFFKTAGDYVGSLGYDESSNSVYFQFPFNSPIKMNNRVSGSAAINYDEFTTKQQLRDTVGIYAHKTDSLLSTKISNDSVSKNYQYVLNRQVQVDSIRDYEIFDNSWGAGTAATQTFRQYRNIIKTNLGLPSIINNALGGTGLLYAQSRQMTNSQQFNNNRFTSLNGSYNHVGQQGDNVKMLNMITYGHKAFIANKLLATAIPASDASISTTGIWSNYNGADSAAMKGPHVGGFSRQTFTPGATMTIPITGSRIVIGVSVSAPQLRLDTMTVTVDGIFEQKFCGNNLINYAPQLAAGVPVNTFLNYYHQATVLTFDNIGAGAHTVVITKGSDSTSRIVIDYIGTMVPPNTASPLVISECPYFTPLAISTYTGLYGSVFTNQTVDAVNRAIIAVVRQFQGYPIAIARVNSHLNLLTDMGPDGIHPTDLGHEHIAQAYLAAIEAANRILFASAGIYKRSDGKWVVGSQVSGATGSAKIYTISKPAGGLYSNTTTTATGAIRITLPTNLATMIVIKGTIYSHTTGQSTTFKISTYGSTLTNGNSVSFSDLPGYQVRYYLNGTTPNIYIGELSTTWGFPKVSIDEVMVGHSNASDLTYASGWSVGIEPTAFVGTLAATVDARATGTAQPVYSNAPALTNPTVTTQAVTDNSTKAASTAYVQSHFLTATATLDFPSTAAQSSSELTITVTGAADGDVVSIGVPNASSNANSCFTARVSAANTVTVKFNNYSSGSIDPVSGTFKPTVFK